MMYAKQTKSLIVKNQLKNRDGSISGLVYGSLFPKGITTHGPDSALTHDVCSSPR